MDVSHVIRGVVVAFGILVERGEGSGGGVEVAGSDVPVPVVFQLLVA